MRVALVYPYPCDDEQAFEPYANRYVERYLKFPPGTDHDLYIAAMNPQTPDDHHSSFPPFNRLKCGEIHVHTNGLDIGAAILCSRGLAEMRYDFAVFSTSRTYFHREGWLRRLVEAREKHGDGLYGATGSNEAPCGEDTKFPNPHMRTVLYGCDPARLARFPFDIYNRNRAHAFEAGQWNYMKWFRNQGLPVKMVTWDEELDQPRWREPANIFRRGDQTNILCWDKHSDNYRDACPEEKQRLERVTG